MKKSVGATSIAILFALGTASAQNTIENNGVQGQGNAIGDQESYSSSDPARTGRSGGSQRIPGAVGAGAAVGDKEGIRSNDPSRTGKTGGYTDPKRAGQVGDTGQ